MGHRPTERDGEFLRDWSKEHLVYEIDQLVYAVAQHAATTRSDLPAIRQRNAMIESFADHVRCLSDFLWRDRDFKPDPIREDDAFAADFCDPDAWEASRSKLARPELDKVEHRGRIAREIVHLTYRRISGAPEVKDWEMMKIIDELAGGLAAFAELADDRLSEDARRACRELRDRVPKPTSIQKAATGMIPGSAGASAVAGATDAYADRGGTINPNTTELPERRQT